jgi:hypothetical protein
LTAEGSSGSELRLRPSPYIPDEIDDLLWLYDRIAPGALERRAVRLQRAFLARQAV